MSHQYESKRDTLFFESREIRGYYKDIEQPVYVVEPVRRAPRGVIVHVHGLCENAFRFMHVARYWAERGYQVVLFHLAAHGCRRDEAGGLHWLGRLYLGEGRAGRILDALSQKDESDLGAIGEIAASNVAAMSTTTMQDHFDQLEMVWRGLSEGTAPVFISGHSLGGLIACEGAYRIANPGGKSSGRPGGPGDPPAGTILFSPAIRPIARGAANHLVQLSWHTRRTPWLKPAAWALQLVTAGDFRLPTGSARNFVSDIPEQCRLHFEDPLVLHAVKSSYLTRIEKQMAVTIDRARSFPHDVIIFAAENDQIVNTVGTREFGRALQFARGFKANPVTIYKDTFVHNPLRSTIAGEALGRLDGWLEKRRTES